MKLCFGMFLFIIVAGCSNTGSSGVLGRWKVRGPEGLDEQLDIEFRKDQFILHDLANHTNTTFEYKLEGNTMIRKQPGSATPDTSNLAFITPDSILMTSRRYVYNTLTRYKD